jgi:hypothetical protein
MDKQAKKILFKTYWTSKGWIDDANRHTPAGDFEYAKSKGVMFDPLEISFDDFVARLANAVDALPMKKVTDAFLSSLTTKRLDWRSALASHANASREMEAGVIGWHYNSFDDLNVLNFERIKWGGVRHYNSLYNMVDLELLHRDVVTEPTADDIGIFKEILTTIDQSQPADPPGRLRERIKAVYPGSLQEISTLMDILSYADILEPLDANRPWAARGDWGPVGRWRGSDKYNKQRVKQYFDIYGIG